MIFWRIWPQGKRDEQSQPIYVLGVDTDFLDVYGISTITGRPFDEKHMADAYAAGWIFNETAVEAYGWHSAEEAVGQPMMSGQPIIGVIPDFHFKGLQNAVEPMGLVLMPEDFIYITLNIETNDFPQTVAFVNRTMQSFFPGDVFDTFFLNEDFDKQYRLEERVGKIVSLFTLLGIFIASLGLIGLASFVAERRTKEIGVRKVLGATVPGIVYLLSKEFIAYVIVANVIAWPVVYIAMNAWLRGFAFRTRMGFLLFAGAAFVVLMIALCTVSFQAIRAAMSNPVESLRYE
jgi:putative ABC transport system permease protein